MINRWLKLTIRIDPQLVEPLSDFLVGVAGAGVETGAVGEPLYGTVNAYIATANPSTEAIAAVLDQVGTFLAGLVEHFAIPSPELAWELIEEEDWGKNWKEHFHPFAIIPGLVIAPTWAEYSPQADEKVLVMDPGMAFGTGHHATTSLCLEAIAASLRESPGVRVLDVGTGTGILGMAALLLGAGSVTALDNDPEAVRAARENVCRNCLEKKMAVAAEPLSSLQEGYQLVVANIVHDVLLDLADELSRLTAPGGSLLLSGILDGEQLENITSSFVSRGFTRLAANSRGEWAVLCLRRQGEAPQSP